MKIFFSKSFIVKPNKKKGGGGFDMKEEKDTNRV